MVLPVPLDKLVASTPFGPHSNAWALELTLDELACQDRFRPVDAARVAAVRILARAVDHDTTNAALWGQYRKALEELMADGASGDALDELLAGLRDASVGDKTAP